MVYLRVEYPEKKRKSLTHIQVLKTNDRYNGVAERCYREGDEVSANTIFIDGISLMSRFEENKEDIQVKVKKYMKASYIDESMYKTLLNMGTIANNLYAIPIQRADRSIWGVLVFDNNEANKKNFKDELKDAGAHYADIISLTINTFKS